MLTKCLFCVALRCYYHAAEPPGKAFIIIFDEIWAADPPRFFCLFKIADIRWESGISLSGSDSKKRAALTKLPFFCGSHARSRAHVFHFLLWVRKLHNEILHHFKQQVPAIKNINLSFRQNAILFSPTRLCGGHFCSVSFLLFLDVECELIEINWQCMSCGG